jgi:hypothetical protein
LITSIFSGKALVNALMRDNFHKSTKFGPLESRDDAIKIIAELLSFGMFVRVEKAGDKQLRPSESQSFENEALFIWVYEGYNLLYE